MAFQILSLSGGGYLGLYSAVVLADLEQRAGRPLHQCFDLIAGTSIGGIIALGLSSGVPASTIRDAIVEKGSTIFDNKLPHDGPGGWLRFALGIFKPAHSAEPLRGVIDDIVGESRIIGDLLIPTVIPAVNLTNGQPKVFKTPHHPRFTADWQLKLCEVGIATSAAPTFFPIAKVGHELFADGGLVANSPDLLAVHEAVQFLGQNEPEIRVLSIGTTTARFSFSHRHGTQYGSYRWGENGRIVNVIIAAQQSMTNFMMQHRFGDRYIRIDSDQSREQQVDLGVDKATPHATETIMGLAASRARDFGDHAVLSDMLRHVPTNHPFAYGPRSS